MTGTKRRGASKGALPGEAPGKPSPEARAGGGSDSADRRAEQQRRLEEVIHNLLIIGLILSTVLMLAGLGLDVALSREMPSVVPDFAEVIKRVAAIRPSGFQALGLLVLIVTPIVRVACSVVAFAWERDWRYAGVTLVVLLIVVASVVIGR